jgi:hypothetical protein
VTAVLGYKTLMDVVNSYSSMDANGVYLKMAEILSRKCPLLQMLPMVASNQIMSHIDARRTYLATPSNRLFNETIAPTANHSAPLSEGIAMFEDYSEVDAKLCRIQNNPAQFRLDEDKGKIEAFTQALETMLFYGALSSDGKQINGLATRFNSLSTYPNGDSTWFYNVLNGGGTTSYCTSIWIMELGPEKVFGIYPKNLPAGLSMKDLGEMTKESSGSYMQVLRTHYSWDIGIFVKDERCVQRYANIEARAGYTANIFDEETLIDLKNRLPGNGDNAVILCNRTIKTQMDKRAVSQKMNTYFVQDQAGDVWGRPVTRFQGIPVLTAEMIVNTETAAS